MAKDYFYHNGMLLSEDELMHKQYKYMYKKKVNGKWRYYYKGPALDGSGSSMYEKDTPGQYGQYVHKGAGGKKHIVNRSEGIKTLNRSHTLENDKEIIRYESVGTLEQSLNSLSKKTKKAIKKAKNWLGKLLKK